MFRANVNVPAITILIFSQFVTLGGQLSIDCEGQGEGDKWFDGCRWCLCQEGSPLCTQTLCSHLDTYLHPCTHVGAVWSDGGYQCKCTSRGIHCRMERSLAVLLLSEDFQWLSGHQLQCSAFNSQQCVCGLDGVPSCSAQFYYRAKTHLKTITLQPGTFSEWRKIPEVTQHQPPPSSLSMLLGNSRVILKAKEKLKRSYRDDQWNGRVKAADNTITIQRLSVLPVSSNRCQEGSRWYGGSLRCYCDINLSVTCGEPSFVAMWIDGLKLKYEQCNEGDSWEEKLSCRHCYCLVNGVVYCNRSSKCPLPNLINPLHDLSTEEVTEELTGPDVEHWNSWTSQDDTDGIKDSREHISPERESTTTVLNLIMTPSLTNPSVSNATTMMPTFDHTKKTNKSNDSRNNTSLVTIRECSPGTIKTTKCKQCYCNSHGKFDCQHIPCDPVDLPDGRINETPTPTTKRSASTIITSTNILDTSPNPTTQSPSTETSQKTTPTLTTPYVRPFRTLKPYTVIPGNRDYPITYKPLDTSCGQYQVDDIYTVDCNVCLCTVVGPRCTAKNCV